MLSRQSSIATKVIIALVTATTVLLGAGGVIYYQFEKNRQQAGLHDRLVVNTDQLATGLANPVWSYDDRQIDLIIEGMMNDREIYGVVANASGKIHVRLRDDQWRVKVGDREFSASGLLVEKREITFANKSIGMVRVFATPKFIIEELNKALILIISFILIADLIMILSLYLIIWHIILKPLKVIERYAVNVSSAGGTGVTISGTKFNGELERLRVSIEKMISQLDRRYA